MHPVWVYHYRHLKFRCSLRARSSATTRLELSQSSLALNQLRPQHTVPGMSHAKPSVLAGRSPQPTGGPVRPIEASAISSGRSLHAPLPWMYNNPPQLTQHSPPHSPLTRLYTPHPQPTTHESPRPHLTRLNVNACTRHSHND